MSSWSVYWRKRWLRREPEAPSRSLLTRPPAASAVAFDLAPNDPLVPYFLSDPGAKEVDKIRLDSPALTALRDAGVALVVPLVSQGELVGLLNLGPRLSEQDYSSDDQGLLNTLATQAAPALRVAQLVREQKAAVRERERIEQELRVARLIQQTLLPKDVPHLAGWQIAAHYQPARAVGGDFYDFLYHDDGRLGLIVGDVTDKGVPAALVMATTRSVLRTAAQGGITPGTVLERANDLLCPDMPAKMFVTCLYAVLDPRTGRMRFANAGHDLPYLRHAGGANELTATGMPLGLMPGMRYEESEVTLTPGDDLLLYSDGLVEAHNPERAMFGFPRLQALLEQYAEDGSLIAYLLAQLRSFVGAEWEQEDDVTLVTVQWIQQGGEEDHAASASEPASTMAPEAAGTEDAEDASGEQWRELGEVQVPSEAGNERYAIDAVAQFVAPLHLPAKRLEALKTAVGEATMNAMEHGNHYDVELPVLIRVRTSSSTLVVSITDHGGGRPIPDAQAPDLEAKLAELQTPRGWGLFLIKNLVDDVRVSSDGHHHTIELIMKLGGDPHAG